MELYFPARALLYHSGRLSSELLTLEVNFPCARYYFKRRFDRQSTSSLFFRLLATKGVPVSPSNT
uniref:Uncharacterized protein n=1 Tax=Arundo donax TaxID=35708 RepID=A0A0A9F1M3_ARUDO